MTDQPCPDCGEPMALLMIERPGGHVCLACHPPREYVLWMEQQAEIAEVRAEVARLEAERDALRVQLAVATENNRGEKG